VYGAFAFGSRMIYLLCLAGAALPMPGLEELLEAQVFKEGSLGLYFSP
jgi:hypothetical protein